MSSTKGVSVDDAAAARLEHELGGNCRWIHPHKNVQALAIHLIC